jgi:GTP-binding protein
VSELFDLFCDLEASDAQIDFPMVYAIGKLGIAKYELNDDSKTLIPLFAKILEAVPEPKGDPEAPLQILISNLDHDEYLGRIAIGRVMSGTVKTGQNIFIHGAGKSTRTAIKVLSVFEGMRRTPVQEAPAGEIVAIAGIDEITIGDTVVGDETTPALTRIIVEEPTIRMRIGVNTSPFAGKCKASKYLTSRQLRERLFRETKRNLAVRVEDTDSPDTFAVMGRGELGLAILVETMRREGYEMQLGNPEVVTKEFPEGSGQTCEPIERVIIDVPDAFIGTVTERLGPRRGRMVRMSNHGYGRARLEFLVPSRGLIGFRGEFLTSTRGQGLLNTQFEGWEPWGGTMIRRTNGAIVSDRAGVATPYALFHLQARGDFFLSPGAEVYEGMIIGEHNRPNDTDVNAVREKKLTNVRNHGKDENVALAVPKTLTIETAMEWIESDEVVEVTPEAVRVRKAILQCARRPRRSEAIDDFQSADA